MNATDYPAGAKTDAPYVPLTGDPLPTPWDPKLRETMLETGRAVYEETVTDQLLADLTEHIKPTS